jgi:hypothetical protein
MYDDVTCVSVNRDSKGLRDSGHIRTHMGHMRTHMGHTIGTVRDYVTADILGHIWDM